MGRSRSGNIPPGTPGNLQGRDRRHHRPGIGIKRLRYAYFAQASDSAGRYGVAFADLLQHLWRLRGLRGHVRLHSIRHVDDLAHAVACTRADGPAWTDLIERHEPTLVRRCLERDPECHALLIVRRMFAQLREQTRPEVIAADTLSGYGGDRPLRAWLADHTTAQINRRYHAVWCRPNDQQGGGRGSVWRSAPLLRFDDACADGGPSDKLPFPGGDVRTPFR